MHITNKEFTEAYGQLMAEVRDIDQLIETLQAKRASMEPFINEADIFMRYERKRREAIRNDNAHALKVWADAQAEVIADIRRVLTA